MDPQQTNQGPKRFLTHTICIDFTFSYFNSAHYYQSYCSNEAESQMVNWLPSHLKDKFITEPKIRKPAANICSNDQSIMESLYLLPPSSMISLGLALSLPHISFSFVLFPQFPLRLSLFYDLGHLVGFLFILGVRL